jgi:hypothetical protein
MVKPRRLRSGIILRSKSTQEMRNTNFLIDKKCYIGNIKGE